MRIPASLVPTSLFRTPSAEQVLQAFDPAFTPRGIKDLVKAKVMQGGGILSETTSHLTYFRFE